jgi:hypothetical protein
LLAGLLLLLLRLPADPLAPSLTADFDGEGHEETVTAARRRGGVRLEVRDASGKKRADANAPAPSADVIHVELSAGSLGSAGALLAVTAATDASECLSVWRYRTQTLAQLPLRDAAGKAVPDCGRSGVWTFRWETEAEGRPAALVRERSEKTEQGTLRIRDVFAFAGFSLDADAKRSSREIEGVPIPAWYGAVLYPASALEVLYARFDLSRLRAAPTLSIVADRERGVFKLRFAGPQGTLAAPVESYAAKGREATLGARSGEKTVRATVRLGGDGSIPLEVGVEGLGAPWDASYGPAGSWHGRADKVYPTAADELASDQLVGTWVDPDGGQTPIGLEGAPPFRVRLGSDSYVLDLEGAERPVDLLLLPAGAGGRPWGITLRGKNFIERIPYGCPGDDKAACRPEGPPERLRRLGGRANVQ